MSSVPPLWICPPADGDRVAAIEAQLEAWTSSSALGELIAIYGGEQPVGGSVADRLGWLEAFSSRWDFRGMAREQGVGGAGAQDSGGAARWELLDSGLESQDDHRVVELARDLGLVENQPPFRRDPDFLLILGGARLSNLLRPRYAGELISAGRVDPGQIVLLGGSRAVMATERDATDSYAPGADTEFDLLTAAAAQEFGFDLGVREEDAREVPDNPNASWRVLAIPAKAVAIGRGVLAIEAPSPEPELRRANTADAYAFFARHRKLERKSSCLLVTSQIYVPYQHLEAVRSLAVPFGLDLETVGFPADWQAELQGMQRPVNYLQEVRSTIQAAKRLHRELVGEARD
jgi:hypothetical protein